ncbi:angiopoietin-2-like [Hyalella azteca]|uniref:Angiopoietin-2-like n=1 Tax=Hyalella azteca TaxID=294128 RepID=A0A979FUI2_HYAAZ|nr:angiopoietin-2-like [Hyalella azteca]
MKSEDDISIDKFIAQQQRTYEELQELADVLRTETSGTENKKSSFVNVVEDLMTYRRCIVEGGELASSSVDTTTRVTTDGGGWTVFLRRQKQEPQLNFSRTFNEYEEGFGSPAGEYWLGLENLHLLTTRKMVEMKAVIVRGVKRTSARYLDFK